MYIFLKTGFSNLNSFWYFSDLTKSVKMDLRHLLCSRFVGNGWKATVAMALEKGGPELSKTCLESKKDP